MIRKRTTEPPFAAPAGLGVVLFLMSAVPAITHAEDAPTPPPAQAAETREAVDVDVEVFKSARLVRYPDDDFYPVEQWRNREEGWVEVSMMIDPKGKPYQITVVDSSNPVFEQAAVKLTNSAHFEPARRGRTTIDSSFNFKVTFTRDGPHEASADFVAAYKQAARAIQAGDRAEADVQLARMHVKNLFEDAFQHYIGFLYYQKWGTPEQQLVTLKGAIAGEQQARLLPDNIFRAALIQLFSLEVKMRDYASALELWKTLQPIVPRETREQLKRTVSAIHAIQLGNAPVRLSATIGNNSSWSRKLFRKRFSLDVGSGSISEIKLRCEKQYLRFKYQPDVQYSIGPMADQCSIEVVGDPGTTFDLVQ